MITDIDGWLVLFPLHWPFATWWIMKAQSNSWNALILYIPYYAYVGSESKITTRRS